MGPVSAINNYLPSGVTIYRNNICFLYSAALEEGTLNDKIVNSFTTHVKLLTKQQVTGPAPVINKHIARR